MDNQESQAIGYKRLLCWQKADLLAKTIYNISSDFPKSEIFGITSQIRRASLSIVLNIIEGYSRDNPNELRQFLRISLGSLAETGYLIEFANDQRYINNEVFSNLVSIKEECGRLLWKFYKSLH